METLVTFSRKLDLKMSEKVIMVSPFFIFFLGGDGVRGKNPPVTALPCQPPLGKGAEGTGDADVPVAVPKISALPYGGRWKF